MLDEKMLSLARNRLATIASTALVEDVADLMSKPHVDLVVVTGEEGEMVGVLTKSDIIRHLRRCVMQPNSVVTGEIMTRSVIFYRVGDVLKEIWAAMEGGGPLRVPVLDDDQAPVGIIYARDALRCLLGNVESDEALLRDYVMHVGYH